MRPDEHYRIVGNQSDPEEHNADAILFDERALIELRRALLNLKLHYAAQTLNEHVTSEPTGTR